ncbi:hypothetical protein KCU73_g7489, partial [Aureobasidium melanogenum]
MEKVAHNKIAKLMKELPDMNLSDSAITRRCKAVLSRFHDENGTSNKQDKKRTRSPASAQRSQATGAGPASDQTPAAPSTGPASAHTSAPVSQAASTALASDQTSEAGYLRLILSSYMMLLDLPLMKTKLPCSR